MALSGAWGSARAVGSKGASLNLAPELEKMPSGVVGIAVQGRTPVERDALLSEPSFRRFFGMPANPRSASSRPSHPTPWSFCAGTWSTRGMWGALQGMAQRTRGCAAVGLRGARAVAVAVGFLVAACAPMQWVDMRTGTAEDAEAALEDCRLKAWDEAWRTQWLYEWPPAFYQPHPRYPGWRRPFWVGRPFTDALRHRLEDFCMRSKGFRLVEVRKD